MNGTAQEHAIIIVGGFTDAPGFKIVSDGHGGFKVVPIPGWNPEQMVELGAALNAVALATRIKQPEVSRNILNAAANFAQAEIGKWAGGGAAGQTTVVVLGA